MMSVPVGLDEPQIPGAYPDSASLSLPPVSTSSVPAPADPAIPHRQTRRQPARFRDILPEPPVPTPPIPVPPNPRLPAIYLIVTNPLTTALNAFGLFHKYLFHLSYDPDSVVDPGDLSNITLGARGHLPIRYMLNTLQLLVKSNCNFPSVHSAGTFQMSAAICLQCPQSTKH